MNSKALGVLAIGAIAMHAPAQVTQLGTALVVDAGGGRNTVVIDVTDGFTTVSGISGHNPAARLFGVRTITYRAANGFDDVTLNMTITTGYDIAFEPGNGGSRFDVNVSIPRGIVDFDLDTICGSSTDTLELDITSDATILSVDWTVDAGPGPVNLRGNVGTSDRTTSLDVALSGQLGSGSDDVHFDVVSGARGTPGLIVDLAGSRGSDIVDVTWDQRWLATVNALVSAELGNGADVFTFAFDGTSSASSVTLLGLVKGQNGPDTLNIDIDGDASSLQRVSANNGPDIINFDCSGDLTGAPDFRAGKGPDTINYTVGGTDTSLAAADGGGGNDTCNGPVTSTNCETVNP